MGAGLWQRYSPEGDLLVSYHGARLFDTPKDGVIKQINIYSTQARGHAAPASELGMRVLYARCRSCQAIDTDACYPLQRPGSEPREQDGNVQKEWSYSQSEHNKPDGWWHPFMIADGPMRSRAVATSPGDACLCTHQQRMPLPPCYACDASVKRRGLLNLTEPKVTRISCHHLCIAQDAFLVHALLCRCPSMCRSMTRPHRSLAASCSSGESWTTLALQGIAHR